ncbi:MAG: NADPH:quinone oxidoreductase family protein [Actinomycetota bacterium]
MLSVVCSALGPLSQVTVGESESPPLAANQVRIKVAAAGVNFVDALFVQGKYQTTPPVPFVPGSEISGRVIEVAPGVTTFEVGSRVFANVRLGGYASEVVVDAKRVRPTPEVLSDGQAATFTQSYLTAWFALVQRAHAQPGQTLLVLGAGSGVGLAGVDLGSALGLRVIAAASTSDKREAARSRGADAVIDSANEDVKARARELTGGDGVDIIYDPVGGVQSEEALRALREDGQLLVIGFASGTIPRFAANQILLRNRRVTGVEWGSWAVRNPDGNDAMLNEVLTRIERRELTPVEPVTYRLAHAAQAMQDQLDRRVTGKAVLVP